MRYLLNRHNSFESSFNKVSVINTYFTASILDILKSFYRYKKHIINVKYNEKEYIIDENELLHNFLYKENSVNKVSQLKIFD
jgi:hypothetical protein